MLFLIRGKVQVINGSYGRHDVDSIVECIIYNSAFNELNKYPRDFYVNHN
jgi:hypothetical protein